MKKVVKPLEWILQEWNYQYTADTIFPDISFIISEHQGLYYVGTRINFGEYPQRTVFETGFKSLEKAKADCQKYYDKLVLSGITQKAKAIFEQFNSTDDEE